MFLFIALASLVSAQSQCATPDCSTVRCASTPTGFDACKDKQCAAFPSATCCPGCCSSAVWKLFAGTRSEQIVDCDVAPVFTCPRNDCSTVRCARAPTPCDKATCGGHPRATCCETCCGEPTFHDPTNGKQVVCTPQVDCAAVDCADKATVDKQCAANFPRGYELLAPDASVGRCCYQCVDKPVIACRCQADAVTKAACDVRFGVGKYTTFRDETCGCLQCTAIDKCALVKCASEESVKADCKSGIVVKGECCFTCKEDIVCPAIACRPAEDVKKECDANGGLFVSGPCCPSCQIRPVICPAFCPSVNEKECIAAGGKVTQGKCCPSCEKPDVVCPAVLCRPADEVKKECDAKGGAFVAGPCCPSCEERVVCPKIACRPADEVKKECDANGGAFVAGPCCPSCEKPDVVCPKIACRPAEEVKKECDAKGGAFVAGPCCPSCEERVVCPEIACQPAEDVKKECDAKGGMFVSGPCCPSCAAPTSGGDACQLPIVAGNGRAAFPSFAWDSAAKKCSKFIYGGVGGNANRFSSEEACLKKCGQPSTAVVVDEQDGMSSATSLTMASASLVLVATLAL
jgi:hypothetical protein